MLLLNEQVDFGPAQTAEYAAALERQYAYLAEERRLFSSPSFFEQVPVQVALIAMPGLGQLGPAIGISGGGGVSSLSWASEIPQVLLPRPGEVGNPILDEQMPRLPPPVEPPLDFPSVEPIMPPLWPWILGIGGILWPSPTGADDQPFGGYPFPEMPQPTFPEPLPPVVEVPPYDEPAPPVIVAPGPIYGPETVPGEPVYAVPQGTPTAPPATPQPAPQPAQPGLGALDLLGFILPFIVPGNSQMPAPDFASELLTPVEPEVLPSAGDYLPPYFTQQTPTDQCNCRERKRQRRRKCRAKAPVRWAGGPKKGQLAGKRCISWET
jgi:hypothetical protein